MSDLPEICFSFHLINLPEIAIWFQLWEGSVTLPPHLPGRYDPECVQCVKTLFNPFRRLSLYSHLVLCQ